MSGKYSREKFSNFPLYKRRWLMLFYFSFCCMADNIICFTFAPINKICYELYGYSNNIFPQVYLIVYAIFSIPVSFLLSEFSIRTNVVCSAWLQFVGCLLRYLYWENLSTVMFGQFLSSVGQIVFVNAPPEVSLTWFPENERIVATSISIISNILGTALIYIYVPFIVGTKEDVQTLLLSICWISFIGAFLTFFFFENAPPGTTGDIQNIQIYEEIEKNDLKKKKKNNNNNDNNNILTVGFKNDNASVGHCRRDKIYGTSNEDTYFHDCECENESDVKSDYYDCFEKEGTRRGERLNMYNIGGELRRFMSDLKVEVGHILSRKDIIKIIIIFCYSECLISSFSTDMSIVLKEKSVNKAYFAATGFLFIINTVVGSAILCFNANIAIFKKLLLLCISMIMVICIVLNFTTNDLFAIFLLGAIGFWCGPIQPISVEMAALNVYPLSSNLCTSIIQVVSFTVSAIFISIFSYMSKFFNINNPILFISFFILCTGFYLTPTVKTPVHALAFSLRSGMIKRETLHVSKCAWSYNMNNNVENHSEHLLEVDTDICLMHSDSQIYGRRKVTPLFLQAYSRLSSLPHHSSILTTSTDKSKRWKDNEAQFTRGNGENTEVQVKKEIHSDIYEALCADGRKTNKTKTQRKANCEEADDDDDEEKEFPLFRIDEIEKYRGEYLSAFHWKNKENFENMKEQLLMCENKKPPLGKLGRRRLSECYMDEDYYNISERIEYLHMNDLQYNTA